MFIIHIVVGIVAEVVVSFSSSRSSSSSSSQRHISIMNSGIGQAVGSSSSRCSSCIRRTGRGPGHSSNSSSFPCRPAHAADLGSAPRPVLMELRVLMLGVTERGSSYWGRRRGGHRSGDDGEGVGVMAEQENEKGTQGQQEGIDGGTHVNFASKSHITSFENFP